MNDLHKILSEITAKTFYPTYCLMGDEAFFIDRIEQRLIEEVLEPHERDFNLHILYGKDSDTKEILSQARQYPAMATRQLLLIREAQWLLPKLPDLLEYFKSPVPTTVLVLCIRGKKIASNSRVVKAMKEGGALIFESKQMPEYQWFKWVKEYVTSSGHRISPEAAQLLLDSVGGRDLARLAKSIDKLLELVPPQRSIQPEDVDRYIGISREFNYFEFKKALGERNFPKLISIARYLSDPSKKNETPALLGVLIAFLNQVLKVHSLLHLNDNSKIAAQVGIAPFLVPEYRTAAANYNMKDLTRMIALIREMDARSKGVEANHYSMPEVLKELLGAVE